MSFLCTVGLHRAERLPRWNKGYYFSRCRRCQRDLVRAAGGAWFVPHGYRVVWLAEPPAWAEPARLVTSAMPRDGSWSARLGAAARANLDRWRAADARTDATLPISDVLRDLHARGVADDPGEAQGSDPLMEEPRPENAAPAGLAEAEAAPSAVPADPPEIASEEALLPEPDAHPPEEEAGESRSPEMREEAHAADLDPPALTDDALAVLVESGRHARRPAKRWVLIGLALFALATLAAIVIAALRSNDMRTPQGAGLVMPPTSAAAAATETVFVTARIVNCRASPADRAATLRRLPRGASVVVLARADGWTSVSHRRRQCWIASRYLSRDAPL